MANPVSQPKFGARHVVEDLFALLASWKQKNRGLHLVPGTLRRALYGGLSKLLANESWLSVDKLLRNAAVVNYRIGLRIDGKSPACHPKLGARHFVDDIISLLAS